MNIEIDIPRSEMARLTRQVKTWQVRKRAATIALIEETVDAIWKEARADAPVDEGDYRKGIKKYLKRLTSDLSGAVVATDWKSHFIEFGTVDMRADPVLKRAAEKHIPIYLAKLKAIYAS